MGHDVAVVEKGPGSVSDPFASQGTFTHLRQSSLDALDDRSDMDIRASGAEHEVICNRRDFPQVQNDHVGGFSVQGERGSGFSQVSRGQSRTQFRGTS